MHAAAQEPHPGGGESRFVWLLRIFGVPHLRLPRQSIKERAEEQIDANKKAADKEAEGVGPEGRTVRQNRIAARLKAESIDPGVTWLPEPYLSQYTLEDFDRLKQFLNDRRAVKGRGEVTCEQPELITDFYIENGYQSWDSPALRTASAFNYLMNRKKPILRENDLLAGTYTPNPISGTVTQPYTIGWSIWSELRTVSTRVLDRYEITEEDHPDASQKSFPFLGDDATFVKYGTTDHHGDKALAC